MVMVVIVFLLVMIGNLLVIYVVYMVNYMKNLMNIFIVNMVVVDFFMSIDLFYIFKFFFIWSGWFGMFMGVMLYKFFYLV